MNDLRRRQLPILEGAVLGLLAWVVGYVLTYLLVAPEVRDSPLHRILEAFEGEPATYEMVGWVFYNAHFVNTVFRDVPVIGSYTTSFIGGDDGFALLLYAIPTGILLALGLGLARYTATTDPTQGALAGVTVLPGYLIATVAGVFLVEVTVAGSSGRPDLLAAFVLAGLVYPVLFGGIGGALGGYLESRDSSRL